MSRSAFLHGIGDFIVSSLPPLMTRTVLGRRYPKFGSGVQNIAVYLRLGRGSRINVIIQCTGRLHEILNGMFDFIVSNVSPLITWTAWGGRCPNIVVLCFFILAPQQLFFGKRPNESHEDICWRTHQKSIIAKPAWKKTLKRFRPHPKKHRKFNQHGLN